MRAWGAARTRLLLSLLLAVAIFAFLVRRVDVAGVRAEIQEMTWVELVTIALLAGWNLVSYWLLWMAVTPGLTWAQAATVAQSGTAVTNTVPGGSGIGVGLAYAMLDSWGVSRARSTLAVLVTGVWNTFISSPCRCSPWPWSPSRATPAGPGSRPGRWRSPCWWWPSAGSG